MLVNALLLSKFNYFLKIHFLLEVLDSVNTRLFGVLFKHLNKILSFREKILLSLQLYSVQKFRRYKDRKDTGKFFNLIFIGAIMLNNSKKSKALVLSVSSKLSATYPVYAVSINYMLSFSKKRMRWIFIIIKQCCVICEKSAQQKYWKENLFFGWFASYWQQLLFTRNNVSMH